MNGPEGKRARDLAPAARQAPEPARRTIGVNSFSEEASAVAQSGGKEGDQLIAMTPDDEFLRAFFSLTLPNSEFHHRDHLRLAWLVVRRHGGDVAEEMVATGIRRFAQHHSHGPLYHDTMTRFWVRLVAHAVSNRPEIVDFEEFLAAYPLLLDKNTPLRHWSREAMFGAEARAEWREPDRVALPF